MTETDIPALETPGAMPEAAPLEQAEDSPASAPAEDAALKIPPGPSADAGDQAKQEALQEQLAVTAKLVGDRSALDWGHLNGAAAVQPGYSPVEAGLPDQLDIDPDTITQPVLSRQGWVLPKNDPRAR